MRARQAVGGFQERHAPQARETSSGAEVPRPVSAISQVWRMAQHSAKARQACRRGRRCRAAGRGPSPRQPAPARRRRPPAAAMVVRQSDASTASRSGACPNTPPAMPMAMARPDRMAKWSGGNHWPAMAMAPTRLKAADAPIRKPAGGAPASVSLPANRTQPPRAHQRGDRHQPARAEAVEQQPDRHLHAGVAVEVGGGQMAEHAGADREIAHQFFDHDAGRHAQHPGIEEEQRAREPSETGAAGDAGGRAALWRRSWDPVHGCVRRHHAQQMRRHKTRRQGAGMPMQGGEGEANPAPPGGSDYCGHLLARSSRAPLRAWPSGELSSMVSAAFQAASKVGPSCFM